MSSQHDEARETAPQSSSPRISRRAALTSAAAIIGASALADATTVAAAPATPVRAAQTAATTPRKGQVGFVLSHEQFPVTQLVTLGQAAERAGFDIVWTSDHIQPWMENEGHEGLAVVTLSSLGARTQRIPFGTGVTCPTMRYHPSVIAQAFATLGMLYPGRVFLGVGSGEALNEQNATGMQFPRWQERSDRLVEAVQLIRQLWTGQTTSFQGQYYKTENTRLYDLPSVPVPIYMAGNGKKSIGRAAQYGDGVITDPMTLMKYKAEFDAGARAAGKDPATVPILVESFVVVGGKAEAEEAAAYWRFIPRAWKDLVYEPDPRRILHISEVETPLEEVYKDWPISTDPAVHVEALMKLFDMGATQVYVHSGNPNQQRTIDFFGQQVLPRLRRAMGTR